MDVQTKPTRKQVVGPLNSARWYGERCKLPYLVRQTIFSAFWAEKCFW